MSVNKRKRDLLKIARAICPTATIEQTNGSHLKVRIQGPKGSEHVIASASPSDHRDTKNFKRDLTRAARNIGLLPPLERTNDS